MSITGCELWQPTTVYLDNLYPIGVCLHRFGGSGNGGGFYLACEDFGRKFDHSFPACVFLI